MAGPVRIVVVADQALARTGVRMLLAGCADLDVVGTAGEGAEALRLLAKVEADVVVMDVRMPVMDGVEATRRLMGRGGRRPHVLLLASSDTDPGGTDPSGDAGFSSDADADAFLAVHAGGRGYLSKDVPATELITAVRAIARGDAVVAPRITRRLLERFADQLVPPLVAVPDGDRLAALTEREREVLSLVARGLSNTEIAGRLRVAQTTVKTHVSRVLTKMKLRDRAQAVVLAYESGLVRPGG